MLLIRRANAQGSTSNGAGSADARAQAQKHFEQGFALGSANQWEAALSEFLTSRAIFPTESATRNAAITLRRLGRNAQALELYTALLREFSPLDPAEAKTIQSEMSVTELRVGWLEIRANDVAIRVAIDGVQYGVTPIAEAIRLDDGPHTLRLSKDGFETSEMNVSVTGGQRQQVNASLEPLVATGELVVQEASGRSLDTVVDLAVVGKTPWTGKLAPGRHLVSLRGDKDWGTPPSAANVAVNRTTTLTLRALTLDAELQIEPTPSNASVYLDRLLVGNGVWVGRLPSGSHRVDVVAATYTAFHQEVLLEPRHSTVLQAALEPDSSNPLWRRPAKHPFYVELEAGALLGRSLGGGTDEACGCASRSRPSGEMARLRVGYALERLGLELAAGYLSVSSSSVRMVIASGDRYAPRFQAADYHDSTNLHGPFTALGVSYRMLERFPMTARVSLGLASLSSRTQNAGTFSGTATNPDVSSQKQVVTSHLAANAEENQKLLTPFGSTELRVGYRFSRVVSADIGAALMIFFPPNVARSGSNDLGGSQNRAAVLVPPGGSWPTGNPVIPGVLQLPHEEVAGTFIALSPSVAIRASF